MEKDSSIDHQQPSSFSWLLDNSNRSSKSLWLQTTLAELDGKIKKILEVVEDDGDTFAQRAEMYYQKRPQLLKMVGDLHKSYRALADKYDLIMLRSESLRASNCCNNSGHMIFPRDSTFEGDHQELTKQQKPDTAEKSDHREMAMQQKPNPAEKKPTLSVKKSEDSGEGHDQYHYHREEIEENAVVAAGTDQKQGWDELLVEVSKLIEQNTSKQAELIRRYNMKREDMKRLAEENRRLRDQLAQRKIDVNKPSPSQTNTNSIWKASNLFGKLLR